MSDLGAQLVSPWCGWEMHWVLQNVAREGRGHDLQDLAVAANVHERYLREWLSHQAASNYLAYDPASHTFTLPPEQAMLFADEDSPATMLGAFDSVAAWADGRTKVQAAFRKGGGVAWGDFGPCLFCAVARFFRPGYLQNLVPNWLPALDGVVMKPRWARVADVCCGHGWSTVLMAQAFPNSQFFGFDFHPGSIEQAKAHAREHNVSNVQFQVATAKTTQSVSSTSSRSSTVCMTWATRPAPQRM